jgi:hypothetical protein
MKVSDTALLERKKISGSRYTIALIAANELLTMAIVSLSSHGALFSMSIMMKENILEA